MSFFGDRETRRQIDGRQGSSHAGDAGIQALYGAASRLADARRGVPRFKTRDLVGLLLTHGARSWRNSQPRVDIRVRALAPNGNSAVRLKFG